jgi:hypothetical protein
MLEVERSTVFHYSITGAPSKGASRKFVRFFMCAQKNGRFQATVTLEEAHGEKIKDVRVVGSAGAT